MPSLACPRIFAPVATSPVSEIMRTCGCFVSGAPTEAPRPHTTLTTPAGRISARSSPSLSAVERGLLRGLEHAGVAGRDRGAELPRGHHERVVPRRDRRHDAHRVAADHAGVAGEVLARDCAGHGAAGAREKAEHVGDRGDLVGECGRIGFAAVPGLEPRIGLAVRLDAVGEPQQQRGAVLRRRARPAVEGGVGSLHRGVDLAARGLGHLREHLARRRVQHLLDLALARDELAVDEQSGLHVSLAGVASRTQAPGPARPGG